MTQYISCADTAKLIRQALKESFPGIKFSVRSSTYSGGASIRVSWVDGPNSAQVEAVAGVFQGAYFDGMTDFKGSRYAMIDGQQVSFGADFLFFERACSDAAIERAIDRVYREYEGNFNNYGVAKPTVEQYRGGALYSVDIMGSGNNYWALQGMISRVISKASDRLAVAKSKTRARVIYLGNDGYSQTGALQAEEVA